MDKLPISSKYRTRAQDPVPDHERQQLSEQLNDAFSRGDLSSEEFEPLLDGIMRARTLGDLVPAVEALGRPDTYEEPAIVKQESSLAPGEVTPLEAPKRSSQLAVVGVTAGAAVLVLILIVLLIAL